MNLRDQRFWTRVQVRGPGDCWPYMSGKTKDGYGRLCAGSKFYYAHRVSYLLAHGELSDDLLVCHTCDNPECVNPAHLFAGTRIDNARDCANKGRTVLPGLICEQHPMAKLTAQDVRDIRERFQPGLHGNRAALAKEFGITPEHVWGIATGRCWKP